MLRKVLLSLFFMVMLCGAAHAQIARIRIVAPKVLEGRKAILLTREREFAAIVHSISLGFDTTHLQMSRDLLPDLYQFQISKMKGSLTFFFEPGTEIILDTANLARSKVNYSRSDREWHIFQDSLLVAGQQNYLATARSFISLYPKSYVSLYLLKTNWYTLKNEGLFEKLDPALDNHRNYRYLKAKSAGLAKASR